MYYHYTRKDTLCPAQSWNRSGSPAPVRPDRTRPDEKFIRPDETGFLSDFCQFDVKNEPDGFYRIFSIFCRIFAGLTSKMIRPDFDRTGPDKF
jgi:hypothetical protein